MIPIIYVEVGIKVTSSITVVECFTCRSNVMLFLGRGILPRHISRDIKWRQPLTGYRLACSRGWCRVYLRISTVILMRESTYKYNKPTDVREIKLRQQNWFKQREEHKHKDESGSGQENQQRGQTSGHNSKANSTSGKATLSRTQSADGRLNTRTLNSNKTTNKTQVNTRGKFQNWLQSRETKTDHDQDSELDSADKRSVPSTSGSIHRGTSAPALHKTDHQNGHPDYMFLEGEETSDDETSEELRSRLLAPEDFDALADKIVSRARFDVGGSRQNHGIADNSEKQRNLASEFGMESSSNMLSHHCACCSEIMIGSGHTPMLLIPCGHTVCRSCCQGRELCPDCYCSIGSTTCNIMLQQIIQEYQGKKTTTKISPSRTYRKNDQYSPNNYQENRKTSSASSNRHQYKEQLQNLKTRLEILASEKSDAKQECERLSDDIKREAHQVRNISKQEDNICSQISSLEEKLAILRQHKGEYESRCEELKCEREEAQKRLAMLKDTMETLGNELEKVKLLSEA